MNNALRRSLAVCALVLVLTGNLAKAATLSPGDSIVVSGTTSAARPELAGAILQDSVLSTPNVGVPNLPFSFARFEVQNRVVESALDGTMVFMPRILFGSNLTAGNLLVDRVEMFGFGNFAIDANYRIDGVGDRGPTFASRTIDGETLDFTFGIPLIINNLAGGIIEESQFFALKTDAPAFENTGRISIFARAEGDNFNTYRFDAGGLAVPVSPVPLPASATFLVLGLFALMTFSARRRLVN